MQTIKVLFVCLGNICRSPIAHGIFETTVKNLNLSDYFEIDSAGTSAFHIGSSPDFRSIDIMKKHGIILNHKARQLKAEDLLYYDYVMAMDHLNYEEIINLSNNTTHYSSKVFLLRSFDPMERSDFDIVDPYYGLNTDFEEAFQICQRSIDGFIAFLNAQNFINLREPTNNKRNTVNERFPNPDNMAI